jgi:uncharacterized protein (TIGR02001 family)
MSTQKISPKARISLSSVTLAMAVLMGGGALAADVAMKKEEPPKAPVPFDFAFGVRGTTNYIFRGISQTSNWGPSPQAYGEAQFMDNFFYAGVAYYRTDLPTTTPAEVDLTAGIRPKLGPFTFDFGVIGYYYPSERRFVDLVSPLAPVIWTPRNTDFTEIKATISVNPIEPLTLGAGLYYAWDWLGTGSKGTYYNGTVKYALPELPNSVTWALSGEVGYYSFDRVSPGLGGFKLIDYATWNAGIAFTYKNLTLDLRYYDTNLTKGECFINTSDPAGIALFTATAVATGTGVGRSNWCDATFVATLSADFTLSALGALPK